MVVEQSRAERRYNWRALSPRSKAVLAWIAVPIADGFTSTEVADRLNLYRPEIPNLELPPVVTIGWIASQMRKLRAELEIKVVAP